VPFTVPGICKTVRVSSAAQATGRSQCHPQQTGVFTNVSCLLQGQHGQSSEEQQGKVEREAAYRVRSGVQKEEKLAEVQVASLLSHTLVYLNVLK